MDCDIGLVSLEYPICALTKRGLTSDQMIFRSSNCSRNGYQDENFTYFDLDPEYCGETKNNGTFLNYEITMYGFNEKISNGISRSEHFELLFSCSVKLGELKNESFRLFCL